MQLRTTTRARVALAAGFLVLVAACGSPGSSGGSTTAATTTSDAAAPATCEAVPGDTFVALADDQHLQNPDNVVPALNAAAAAGDTDLVPVLDSVSAVLDTPALVNLNKAVSVDRQPPAQAAADFAAAQGINSQDPVGKGRKVVVGAPNFDEGRVLANLYATVLTAAGYDVSIQDIGNRELYLTDLESGALTVVPEYVSTLTEFLNTAVNGEGATPLASSDLDATVAQLTTLGKAVGLAFAAPAKAQDQNAYAVTSGFAQEHKVATLSELAAACGGIVLGGPPECPERPFCQIGLEQTYGIDIASFVSLDAGGNLTKQALAQGTITLGMILSSDPSLAG
ncbi:osmoprotectant transport system substrate-binding protein [Sanguibacter gelidistatuariae]|uniref:Osmoprotectant transport system substrate-binding protein n=1 Tax=Sanguibacter gelidistatuariae TaxID=1814289 RepID=A0A1G6H545_9MICO|nr:glycine betaine ABC transporter substrate-binding protein [Sanguibacter gelidistatuariae]SDB89379.1 osmoprotectant transport system substrate-binding protein [Sanguibacter gelidistatuariae]